METGPLPPAWDGADPATWRFVSEVAVVVSTAGPDPDDPIVGKREVVTAAADFGHPDDPPLLLGMPPWRAAGWWAEVLGPIHRARVAAVRYPIKTESFLDEERPPWEADPDDPLDVRNPLLPGMLEAWSAAPVAFLDALGFPGEGHWPSGAGGRG